MPRPTEPTPSFRSDELANALAKQDMAMVAFALRNGTFVVPLVTLPGKRSRTDLGQVWTFRQPETGKVALLLFSDAKHKPDALPKFVGLHDGAWLHDFLKVHMREIDTVFFDIAGPSPMQASSEELLRVLDLELDV